MFETGENDGVYWLRLFRRFTFDFHSWANGSLFPEGRAGIFGVEFWPRVDGDPYLPSLVGVEVLGRKFRFSWNDTERIAA